MFAQLEPGAQPSAHLPASAPAEPPDGTQGAWPAALADAFEWPSQPGAAASGAHAGGNGQPTPDLTLEALEGAHSAEGYQPFTLEPGALASFDGGRSSGVSGDASSGAPTGETARALNEFFQGPEEPPLAPAEPEQAAQPTIAPTDYPARLAAARALREQGALDEALVEYRALLKNAPDLLTDVLDDLEASLDEQPEHPELHRLLGDARIRQGDYMAALESLNRSVSLTQPSDE
jgi:tetratricopeptide (TPR) repeat protein